MSKKGTAFKGALGRVIARQALLWMNAAREQAVVNVTNRVLNRRTGLLSNSISPLVRRSRNTIEAGLRISGPAAVYGRIWEITGRRETVVVPVRAKALSWVSDGVRVFAQSVTIPAAKPRPFLRPAIRKTQPIYLPRMTQAVARLTAQTMSRTIGRRGGR